MIYNLYRLIKKNEKQKELTTECMTKVIVYWNLVIVKYSIKLSYML